MTDLVLKRAEEYIQAGFSVHPCSGKIPKIKAWQDKTLSLNEFKSCYSPGDNIGVVMGQKALICCIDVDPRNGGMTWYESHRDELSGALVEKTGGGGLHLYYKYPLIDAQALPSKTAFAAGVDILCDGGKQVVTDPSIHPTTGEPYIFLDYLNLCDVFTEGEYLPQWIVDSLLTLSKINAVNAAIIHSSDSAPSELMLDEAIRFATCYPAAVQGSAGDTKTFAAAARMRDYGLSQVRAYEVLRDHYNPRCVPQWDLTALSLKVANAYKYIKTPFGQNLPENQFPDESAVNGITATTPPAEKKTTSPVDGFTQISIRDFEAANIPPRQHIIGPFCLKTLNMVYAAPGVGKTHFALGIAWAAASGADFLKWKSESIASVLYIDGEMSAADIQERIRPLVKSVPTDQEIKFNFITSDFQPNGRMPDLANPIDQERLNAATEAADLIVIDNISCLVRTGKENEAEAWMPVLDWALRMKVAGKAVLFVHHSGKGDGGARGSSKREDSLDFNILLKHPQGYTPDQGCVFEVEFKKSGRFRRKSHPNDLVPFQATYLDTEFAPGSWAWEDLEELNLDKIQRMLNDGVSQKDIAIQLGVTAQYVSNEIRRKGLIKSTPKSSFRAKRELLGDDDF